jgi:predicted dithiol-disulfide oxidoreductase (DUF899 family)
MAGVSDSEIEAVEKEIGELVVKLNALRRANPGAEVPNYRFGTVGGERSLLDLFGSRDKMLVIHNMGQGCRYCTLWADGFNGLVAHLESAMSVVLVSKDPPDVQRRFASSRGWRFRLASHGGGEYMREQALADGYENCPGAVVYERDGGRITRKNRCSFGPGDIYCAMWSLLGLAGMGEEEWVPQYSYWQQPKTLDDGGLNLLDPLA